MWPTFPNLETWGDILRQVFGVRSQTVSAVSTSASSISTTRVAGISNRVRESRSLAYVKAVSELDSGGHVEDNGQFEALVSTIRSELSEVPSSQLPIGIVARCYLGIPYEVHIVDICLTRIIQHYRRGESMDLVFERARSLAQHSAYEFVEVYQDHLVAVRGDGTVSVVGDLA